MDHTHLVRVLQRLGCLYAQMRNGTKETRARVRTLRRQGRHRWREIARRRARGLWRFWRRRAIGIRCLPLTALPRTLTRWSLGGSPSSRRQLTGQARQRGGRLAQVEDEPGQGLALDVLHGIEMHVAFTTHEVNGHDV